MKNSYKFFANKECVYFPCHDVSPKADFNFLFCYCPLYLLECEGNYRYLADDIKDCSNCLLTHDVRAYEYVVGKLFEL